MSLRRGEIGVCVCCGVLGAMRGRGLISPCYQRRWRAGTLGEFPPDADAVLRRVREWRRKGREASARRRAGRVEDYAELRAWGISREQAAARLGVTERTAWRYELILREQVPA